MTESTPTSPPAAGSPGAPDDFAIEAQRILAELTASPNAQFRDGQLESIRDLVQAKKRVLVVQRTGWGKSAVYFVATRMLRASGTGPSLIISPLLALMRDQIAAAERAGVRAASLNSSNVTEWDSVLEDLKAGSL
ncbi:MAG TPA: DEAD/DEAH box helicase, partial [Brevibacterium linens]|nr:DEAD/DEAH box helicase [Brevibacterium linens]